MLYGIVVHLMLFNQYCTLRSSFVNAVKQKCKASMQTTMLKRMQQQYLPLVYKKRIGTKTQYYSV